MLNFKQKFISFFPPNKEEPSKIDHHSGGHGRPLVQRALPAFQ
jgi:hypothetical protein